MTIGSMSWRHRLLLLSFAAFIAMNSNSLAASDRFSVHLADGSVLFDEDDVEQYVNETNTFVLSVSASERLVTNWDAFVRDDEGTLLQGKFPDADHRSFEVLLGTKQLASGTTAASPLTLYAASSGAVLLYGDMPLLVNRHVRLRIGKFCGDLKVMVESGPDQTFSAILPVELATHFRTMHKLVE